MYLISLVLLVLYNIIVKSYTIQCKHHGSGSLNWEWHVKVHDTLEVIFDKYNKIGLSMAILCNFYLACQQSFITSTVILHVYNQLRRPQYNLSRGRVN